MYLKEKGVPHTRFEKEIGLSNGYLKTQEKRSSDLGEGIITKIIDNCLDMNIEWLITGRGPMFKSQKEYNSQDVPPMMTVESQVEHHISNENFIYKMYKEKDEENKTLLKEIGRLEERLEKCESSVPTVKAVSSVKSPSKKRPVTSANVQSNE